MTPAKALLGYELARKGQWEIPEYNKQRRNKQDDAKQRRQTIRTRQLDFETKTFPKQHENPPVTFRRGDLVMVKKQSAVGPFAPVWSGPFPIAMRWSPQIYEINKNGRQYRYHVDQLRPAPAGNPDEPIELESDEDEPVIERVVENSDSSDDEAPPRVILTTAQIHATPEPQGSVEPAGIEVERRAPSPPGKLAGPNDPPREDDQPLDLTLRAHDLDLITVDDTLHGDPAQRNYDRSSLDTQVPNP